MIIFHKMINIIKTLLGFCRNNLIIVMFQLLVGMETTFIQIEIIQLKSQIS